MKKLILAMATVALVLVGCKTDPPTGGGGDPEIKKETIDLGYGKTEFESQGGSLAVTVFSSAEWTIEGTSEYATPSATSGESDETVTFTVNANETGETQTATFTFVCGEGEVRDEEVLTITIYGTPPVVFNLVGEATRTLEVAAGTFEVEINIGDLDIADVAKSVEIISGPGAGGNGEAWISYQVSTFPGNAVFKFQYAENTGLVEREAKLVFASDDSTAPRGKIEVMVTQKKVSKLEVLNAKSYSMELAGGPIAVQVSANVEYDVVIEQEGAWVVQGTTSAPDAEGTVTVNFTVSELVPPATTRSANIKFTEKGGSLSQTVSVTQKGSALVSLAANMQGSGYASAGTSDYNGGLKAYPEWVNTDDLQGMNTLTMEALVYANLLNKKGNMGQWAGNRMTTIMGREGTFIIRSGDAGTGQNNLDELQVCINGRPGGEEGKLTYDGLPNNTWFHLAITYDYASRVCVAYVDGVEKSRTTFSSTQAIVVDLAPLSLPTTEADGSTNRNFWFGWSSAEGRYLDGMIAEARIWNKVLSTSDLAAPNHFYTVDATSEGLVAYWKFDDGGTGTTAAVTDYSKNANHLTVSEPIDWKAVDLP